MSGISVETLLKRDLFSWMSQEDLEMLANCFDMEEESLAAGEQRDRAERIGCLLSGTAVDEAGRILTEGALFGLPLDGACAPMSTVTARTACRLLWMNEDIMTSVCYRACWFHGRFVTEVRNRLK